MIFRRRRPDAAEDSNRAAAEAVVDFADPGTGSAWGSAPPAGTGPAGAGATADVTDASDAAWGSAPDLAARDRFRLTVEDVFTITGRGTVVTGVVESGTIRTGDTVTVSGERGPRTATIAGVERMRKRLAEASKGDQVGLLLSGKGPSDVDRGDVLTA